MTFADAEAIARQVYSASELAELNAAFAAATADYWAGSYLARASWADHIAEELLFRFDQGKRGDELLYDI
jgi:hypothetical protein